MSAPTQILSTSSLKPDTWNHMDPHVGLLVTPTPSTFSFLLLRSEHRYCARSSQTSEDEDAGSIKALTIMLDPLGVVTFTSYEDQGALVC